MTIDLTSSLTGTVPSPAGERPADGLDAAAASSFLAALQNLMTALPTPVAATAAAGEGPLERVTVRSINLSGPRPLAAPAVVAPAPDAQAGASSAWRPSAVEVVAEAGPIGTVLIAAPDGPVPDAAPPVANGPAAEADGNVDLAPLPPRPPAAEGRGEDDPVWMGSIAGLADGEGGTAVADVVARTMPPSIVLDRSASKATATAATAGSSSPVPGAVEGVEPAPPVVPAQAAVPPDRPPLPGHESAAIESPPAEASADHAPDFMTDVEPAGWTAVSAPASLAGDEAGLGDTSAPRSATATVTGLAVAVVDAVHDGEPGIRVALQPEQLGRVDVDLAIGEDGRLHASFTVERPETLQLLQRDQRLLGQALGDAGIVLSDGGLRFSLDQHPTDRQQSHERDDATPRPPAPPAFASTTPSNPPRRQAQGLLDLLV